MSTFEATHARANQGLMLKDAASTATRSVYQLGFWSAVLATLSSIGYGIAVIIMMISSITAAADTPPGWHGIEAFVASFQSIQMLPLIPSLVLAPTFIVLMVSVHYYAAHEKRIWSHLGIAFAIVYAVMASLNYTEIAALGGPSQAIGSVLAIDLSRIYAPTDFGRSAHQDENFFDVKDGIEFSGEDHDLMAVLPLASLATNTTLSKFLAGLGAIGIGQVENG